ncbi:unnamed protein product [Caenorhabditis nigoni]
MPTTTWIPAIIQRFLDPVKQVFASRSPGNLLGDEFAQLGETYTKDQTERRPKGSIRKLRKLKMFLFYFVCQ